MAVDIVMPRLSDSMEEGTILQWFVSEGDAVVEGEPLVEVETDKASVTYESEHDGTLLTIRAQAGESIAVGAVIAVVGAPGDQISGAEVSGAEVSGAEEVSGVATRVKASPLARRIAAQLGVDLATLAGSGPQGRVVRADVERSAAGGANGEPASAVPATARPASGAQATAGHASAAEAAAGHASAAEAAAGHASVGQAVGATGAKGETERSALTRVQRTVARRMAESRATVPDFELRAEVDMSRAVDLREQLRELNDPPPSYNDFIVRAAALALRAFPRVNGSYRDETFEHYARVNVGIAVAAADALVVPTIFDADQKTLAEITGESRRLAERVRAGSISPPELGGGTFSVSNLGMYGIDSFSAVINPPQSAILAVGSLKPRPVVGDDGLVVARPTINLTLACDHRILYGADGARFLARVRELLEKPLSLVL